MKVYVLHVLSSPNRRWAFLGAAAMQQIPQDLIYFAVSPNLTPYDDNISLVTQAAADDGFPFLDNYGRGAKSAYVQQTAGSMGQIWNYCRVYRHIALSGETALISHDDRMLTVPWPTFKATVDALDAKGEFKLFQTRNRTGEWLTVEQQLQTYNLQDFNTDDPFNHITTGLNGFEETMVVTPDGARFILNALEKNAGNFFFLDDFIYNCLGHLSLGVTGIYTPAKTEYAFLREILDFKTLTNWASKESPFYNASTKGIEVNFLEFQDE